jgi:arsenite-transporting ATPase
MPATAATPWPAPSRPGAAGAGGHAAVAARLAAGPVPLRAFDTVGLPALRALLSATSESPAVLVAATDRTKRIEHFPGLDALVMNWPPPARADHGDGQGRCRQDHGRGGPGPGAGQRGKTVHLSTTDPAAHLAGRWMVRCRACTSAASTRRSRRSATSTRSWRPSPPSSTQQEQALLLEDLRSPCTEEVAVFHAFSRIVSEVAVPSWCWTPRPPGIRCC